MCRLSATPTNKQTNKEPLLTKLQINERKVCSCDYMQKKMIKEPNDQITYLAERTGSARPRVVRDWGYQLRLPSMKWKKAASDPRVSEAQGQQQLN